MPETPACRRSSTICELSAPPSRTAWTAVPSSAHTRPDISSVMSEECDARRRAILGESMSLETVYFAPSGECGFACSNRPNTLGRLYRLVNFIIACGKEEIALPNKVVNEVDFVILGEPASAKNQRRIVRIGDMPRLIKSSKGLSYGKSFALQCPKIPLMECDVALLLDVYYASRRPDLAALDMIQDLLQGFIYQNDRQVKASQSLWNLDRKNPRVRIRVKKLELESSLGLSSYSQSLIWGEESSRPQSSTPENGG